MGLSAAGGEAGDHRGWTSLRVPESFEQTVGEISIRRLDECSTSPPEGKKIPRASERDEGVGGEGGFRPPPLPVHADRRREACFCAV